MSEFWKNKNVVITGANGFIGSQIVKDLLEKGAEVLGIVKTRQTKDTNTKNSNFRLINIDLTKQIIPKDILPDSFIVIHTAAIDGGRDFKIKHYKKLYNENIKILKNLLNSIKEKQVEKLIFMSSADVYYKTTIKGSIKETDAQLVKPDDKLGYYAWSKIQGEYLITEFCNSNKINYMIIRAANIYGIGDNPGKQRLVPVLLEKIKENKEILDINVTNDIRSFTYLPDFSDNLLQLIEYAVKGIYNLSSSKSISIRDFVSLFAKYSSKSLPKSNLIDTPGKSTILNIEKAKHHIPSWRDTDYSVSIKKVINSS